MRKQAYSRLKKLYAVVSVLMAILPISSTHAADLHLSPLTSWNVDWSAKSCILRRAFGTKERYVTLQFERFAPGDRFHLMAFGAPLSDYDDDVPVSIKYGDNPAKPFKYLRKIEAASNMPLLLGSSGLGPEAESVAASLPVSRDQEAAISEISLLRRGSSITLATGSLAKPFQALRSCTDDLVKSWGLDPMVQSALSRRATPQGDPGAWATTHDYPQEASNSRKQSFVNFLLLIDATGVPFRCDIARSYSGELFDRTTCDLLMRRARFEPALDASGAPVSSYYANAIRWTMDSKRY